MIDFGLSVKIEKDKEIKDIQGTMLYMAPEVLREGVIGEQSDMWAIGIMFYIMITGNMPYRQTDHDFLIPAIKAG